MTIDELTYEVMKIECENCSFRNICDSLELGQGELFCNMAISYLEEKESEEYNSMNKVILIGRVSKEIELNFMANSGKGVAKFTLAVQRPFNKEEVDFINCVAFGKQAETLAQYVTKGQQLAVEGAIKTGSYEKEGVKRYTTDIIINSFDFIGGNKKESAPEGQAGFNFDNNDMNFEPEEDEDCPF